MTAYHRRMRIAGRAGAAVAAVSVVLTLGACGSDSSTTAADPAGSASVSSTPTPSSTPTGPNCATVWRNGRMLDTAYRGCVTPQGWVKAQVYQCSDGHRMVTFAHVFYAQPGRRITRSDTTLAKDTAFRHTMAVCGA